MTGHGDRVTGVSFEPNGNRAVTGSLDGTAKVWMCTAGKCLKTLKMTEQEPVSTPIKHMKAFEKFD
jgi:WD40 repeat protein